MSTYEEKNQETNDVYAWWNKYNKAQHIHVEKVACMNLHILITNGGTNHKKSQRGWWSGGEKGGWVGGEWGGGGGGGCLGMVVIDDIHTLVVCVCVCVGGGGGVIGDIHKMHYFRYLKVLTRFPMLGLPMVWIKISLKLWERRVLGVLSRC